MCVTFYNKTGRPTKKRRPLPFKPWQFSPVQQHFYLRKDFQIFFHDNANLDAVTYVTKFQ